MSSRDEGIIDVERRKNEAEYVLGDPTVFPPEFLTWLKRYIEQSGIQLPASAIFGNFTAGIGSTRNLAPGLVLPYAGASPPPGALACDGLSYSRTEYAKLFAIIGTTYGSVDVNSFNVPDYRGRSLYGVGGGVETATLISNDGMPLSQRSPKHRHNVYIQANNQGLVNGSTFYRMFPTDDPQPLATTSPSAAAMVDTPAYHAVTYVITTG